MAKKRMGRPPAGPKGSRVVDLPRVTIRLEPDIHRRTMEHVQETGRPLWRLVQDLLRAHIEGTTVPPASPAITQPEPAVEPAASLERSSPPPAPVEPPAEELPELDLRSHLIRYRRIANAVQAEDIGKDSEVWVNFGVNYFQHARVVILRTVGPHGLIGCIVGGFTSARAQILGATPGRQIRFLRSQALQPADGWMATYRSWDEPAS